MAANTNPQLQTQIIYSIYVRNHTPEGTFRAVIPDLDRIRALGTDIIWFLPVCEPRLPKRQSCLRHDGRF